MKQVNTGAPPMVEARTLTLEKFKGIDKTSSVTNVDVRRSPDAPNMMPGADGFPVKRKGYKTVLTLSGSVHAAYTLTKAGVAYNLVHSGTKLYRMTQSGGVYAAQELAQDMANERSTAVQLKEKLWILDGKTYRCYDGEKVVFASSIATVPIITIAKAPNGKNGATSYKPVNLLTGKRTDSFLGTATETDYFVSFGGLKDSEVEVQVLDANGVWQKKTQTTHFTVDRKLGKIKFLQAPGKSPVEGEDNVRITYEVESREAVVNALRFSILFGVNGALDRVFMSGSKTEPNVDYWTEFNDPAYVGDVNYALLGQESSPIVGYSVLNNCLVTHKQNEENGRNAFVRAGELDNDGFAVFKITNVVQGDGACSTSSFASLNSEPMFLTQRGVYALTPSDITGERYAQCRSLFLNGVLQALEKPQEASAVAWGRFYVLAVDEKLYLMDGDQKTYESKSPYSSYQYECYEWSVEARCVWVWNGVLWFGAGDGRICYFQLGASSADYSDDGKAVVAYWTTPLMNLSTWSNKKTVTGVWVACQPYTRSSAAVSYATDRERDKAATKKYIDIFDWSDIDFNRFTFNVMDRPAVVYGRRKAKKIVLFGVKVANTGNNEPFGLLSIQVQYRLGGKVK